MRVIYRKIRHAHYLYIKRNVEKVWGAHYTLGARYLSKIRYYILHNIINNKLLYCSDLMARTAALSFFQNAAHNRESNPHLIF